MNCVCCRNTHTRNNYRWWTYRVRNFSKLVDSTNIFSSEPVKNLSTTTNTINTREYLYDSNKKADVFLSSRKDKFPSGEGSGPIYVCTRNNDLESIIEATPENRKEDLVFIQNGILSEYLKTKRLEDNTQALIYFAISKKGDAPIDGKTDLNPDGLTAVTGKCKSCAKVFTIVNYTKESPCMNVGAKDLANRLNSNGLACHVIEKEPWIVSI